MSGNGVPAFPGGRAERARQRAESLGRVQTFLLGELAGFATLATN